MPEGTLTFTGVPEADELAKLRGALRQADPRAFAAHGRTVRRALRHVRSISPFLPGTPHGEICVGDGARILEVVRRRELGLAAGAPVPPMMILLALPETERGYLLADSKTRRELWRRLYHARVHEALEARLAAGEINIRHVRAAIHMIGQTQFDEARAVLKQEDRILPPGDDVTVLVEFAATFLTLERFEPRLTPVTFTTIADPPEVEALLERLVRQEDLLESTRLAGAADPERREGGEAQVPVEEPPVAAPPRRLRRISLLRRAERAARRGNQVRAAILARRAGAVGRATEALDDLLAGLSETLGIDEEETPAWREALSRLLARAAAGFRSREARVLYDLQKVRVNGERGVFTVDPVTWALSLGRRPLRRALPDAVRALAVLYLRRSCRRLERMRLAGRPPTGIEAPLRDALHHAEETAGRVFRAKIEEALFAVRLDATNVPERVAREKLLTELTERAVERGRLRLGDIRDAVARNQLKLPREGPIALLTRDRLLRADRRLAQTLDGVHQRGEFYLRWLQRFSALALGTGLGAWLVRFLVIPFAGSFVILEGLAHTVVPLLDKLAGVHPHLATPVPIVLLGIFLFLLIHVPPFRRFVGRLLRGFGRGLRTVFVSLPAWLVHLPALARLLGSAPIRLAADLAFRPALYGALVYVLARLRGRDLLSRPGLATAIALLLVILVNRSWWRRAEEAVQDSLARNWRYVRSHVLAGLVRLVISVFRWFLDLLDRTLHTVDEWLRFRGGESTVSVVVKGVLAPVWFLVSYVVRIYVTLLIEPQVNPVKHFPVVTVSHKIIIPMSLTLTRLFAAPLAPLGAVAANAIAGSTVFLLPGVFGFLVWELKENWRLFARNRPRDLKPVPVGHHGESILRLLKPGFHSGTLPKLYRRLRRAETIEDPVARNRRRTLLRQSLEEVRHAVHHFVDRELIAILRVSGRFDDGLPGTGRISTGSNSIRIELLGPSPDDESLEFALEEQSGRLLGGLARAGWSSTLPPGRRTALRNALSGFYKLCGVEILREQIDAALGKGHVPYDVTADGLVVWPGEGFAREVRYDLAARPVLRARAKFGDCPSEIREIPAEEAIFRESGIAWDDWVRAWEEDAVPAPMLLVRVPVFGSGRA